MKTYTIRIVHPIAAEPFMAKQHGSEALIVVTAEEFVELLPSLISDYGTSSEIHLVPNS